MDKISPKDLIFASKISEIAAYGTDDHWLAFTASRYDSNRKQVTDLFLHSSGSFSTLQLTRNGPGVSVSCPTLASIYQPNGEVDYVLFLRAGKVWAVPLEGGESFVVWEEALPINSFQVGGTPQQKYIIAEITVPVHTDSPFSPETAGTGGKGKGVMHSSLMVRYWTEWDTSKARNHLFIGFLTVDPEGCVKVQQPAVDLLHMQEVDCPAKPPAGHGKDDYALSVDGRYMAIACRRMTADGRQAADAAWSTDMCIYLADLAAVDLTVTPKERGYRALPWKMISDPSLSACHASPAFSADGGHLAHLSMVRAGHESDRCRICLYNTSTGIRCVLTEDIDISFQSILWAGDGVLYALAQHRGSMRAFRLMLTADRCALRALEVLVGDDSRTALQLLGEHMYYLESSLLCPAMLKRLDLTAEGVFVPFTPAPMVCGDYPLTSLMRDDGSMHVIHDPVPGYTNGDIALPQVCQHYFSGAHGDPVHCWYLAPVIDGEDGPAVPEAGSVPLLVIVHGGPQAAMLNAWNYRWNLAAFASQGYAVLSINFHGSSGFGSAFQDSIRRDWGGAPFEDIMKGIDFTLKRYPYIQSDRIAALGASYGGYMMNWINGHTDRFRCLVNHAGIYSLRSEYCTTEELFFPEWDLGVPWQHPEVYQQWSPDGFVENWKTPTFVIHGGKDFRVPESEGIATFTTLQRKGIPSQFLHFADEGHWVLQPANSLQWYTEVLAWLSKWLDA